MTPDQRIIAEAHRYVYGHVMRPYQRAWLDQILGHRYVYILGSRQIGKSWLVAYAAYVLASGYVDTGGRWVPGANVLILSKDQRTSISMLQEVRGHIDAVEAAGATILHPTQVSETRIRLRSGTSIRALPGTSRSAQGFTGHVIADELEASDADPEDTLEQALSVASSDERYRVAIVTNSGPLGGFSDRLQTSDDPIWEARRDLFQISSTTIWDAYPDGLPDHLLEIRRIISPSGWRRWYENASVSGAETLVTRDQLDRCREPFTDFKISQTILSIDFGFVKNPSGVVVIQTGGGRARVVLAEHWYGKSLDDQIEDLRELVRTHRVSRIYVDQGAQGWQGAQRLEALWPTLVHKRSTTKASRDREGAALRELVVNGKIEITQDVLLDDIESIILDDQGHVRLPSRPGPRGHVIHADAADALMYCMEDITTSFRSTAPRVTLSVPSPLW